MNNANLPVEYFNTQPSEESIGNIPVEDNNFNFVNKENLAAKEAAPNTLQSVPESEVVPSNTPLISQNVPIQGNTNNTNNTYTDSNYSSNINNVSNLYNSNSNSDTSQNFNNTNNNVEGNQYTNTNSIPQQTTVSPNNSIYSSNTENLNTNEVVNSSNVELKSTINNQISDIDSRLAQLQQKLSNLNKGNKENFFKAVDNNYVESYNTTSPVEVYNNSNYDNEKFSLTSSINNLNSQKNKLLTELNKYQSNNYTANDFNNIDSNLNSAFNTNNISNSNNNTENFVPNLVKNSNTENIGLQLAANTEKFFGEEPKLVSDNGNPVIISESQKTLENAIDDHGGPEQAIKDSIKNQTFVNSLVNTDSSFTTLEEDKAINVPDKNDGMVNNTSKIIEMLGTISSTLRDLANNLSSNQKSTGKQQASPSGTTTSNTSNQINNQTNMNQSNKNQNQSGDSLPSGLRGNYPIKQDFPSNFDVSTLGGSNLH